MQAPLLPAMLHRPLLLALLHSSLLPAALPRCLLVTRAAMQSGPASLLLLLLLLLLLDVLHLSQPYAPLQLLLLAQQVRAAGLPATPVAGKAAA